MNYEIEKYEGELRSLRENIAQCRKVLEKIQKFGHGDGHGRGYTCANWAKEVLENINE